MEEMILRMLEDSKTKGMALMEDTFRRLMRRKATYIMIAILLAPALLAWPLRGSIEQDAEYDETEHRWYVQEDSIDGQLEGEKVWLDDFVADIYLWVFTTIYLRFLIIFSVLLLGVSLVQDEKEDQTLQLLICAPLTRFEVLLYKYLVAVPLLTLTTWVPVCLFYLIMMLTAGTGAVAGHLGLLGVALLLIFLTCAAFTAVFFAITTFVQRALMASAAYTFLWEGWLGGLNLAVQKVTVSHYIRSAAVPALAAVVGEDKALDRLGLVDFFGNDMQTSWILSLVVLAVLSVTFLGLAVVGLRSRDVT